MEQSLSWIATGATIIAASVTASNLGTRITGYGFVIFLLGSVCWFVFGLASGQPALMWTNGVLTFLNIFGIWRWLGRQARIEEGAKAGSRDSEAMPGDTLFPLSILSSATVRSADGSEVGRSVDAMAGCNSGRIEYLVTSQGGVAGAGELLRRMNWSDCRVDGDDVVTGLTASEFETLDPIERDHWPGR